DQRTAFRVAGHDDGAVVAAAAQSLDAVQARPAALLVGPVTGGAVPQQDGADAAFDEGSLFQRRGSARVGRRRAQDQHPRPPHCLTPPTVVSPAIVAGGAGAGNAFPSGGRFDDSLTRSSVPPAVATRSGTRPGGPILPPPRAPAPSTAGRSPVGRGGCASGR